MAKRVSLVFDREFGDRLADLAMKMEVWIAESEANRKAADDVFTLAHEWPHITVTIFRAPDTYTEETWRMVLEQMELHHRPATGRTGFDTVDIVGAEATEEARSVLAEFGFESISLTREGFRAAR